MCYLSIKRLTKTDLTKIVRETGKAGTPTLTRGPTRGGVRTPAPARLHFAHIASAPARDKPSSPPRPAGFDKAP